MAVSIYLLSLEEILGTDKTEQFVRTAMKHVDEERAKKVETIKSMDGKAVSLGAGLLLQRMVRDYRENPALWQSYGNTEVCRLTAEAFSDPISPLQLQYSYGPKGKPEILDFPLQFNLSHSGQYILCVVSPQGIGADIQQKKTVNVMALARRFFHPAEYRQLVHCCCDTERLDLFYEMWTRKEAYGKLTGEGVPSVLQQDVSQNLPQNQNIEWITLQPPKGYAVAVCTDKS